MFDRVARVPHNPTVNTDNLPDQRTPGMLSQCIQLIRKQTLFISVNAHLRISEIIAFLLDNIEK